MDERLRAVVEMNEATWTRFERTLADVGPDEIDWRPLPQANTINLILRHLRIDAAWHVHQVEREDPIVSSAVQTHPESLALDFDQNLNLVASFAMAPPRKEIPVLSEILRNTQFQVPITGTFKKPRLNGDAIAARFKDMGLNMLDTVIGAGASGLGRILQRGGPAPRGGQSRDLFPPFVPPSPDQPPLPPQPGSQDPRNDRGSGDHPGRRAQPPPASPDDDLDQPAGPPGQLTPQERQLRREERKARRLEKRAERRLQRGLPPQ